MHLPRIVVMTLFVLACLCIPMHTWAQPAKKLPIPSAKDQEKADALIKELYKDELAKADAKDLAANQILARTFLMEAQKTDDYPAGRYVLLDKAIVRALQVADFDTAVDAIDEMAQHFVLPPTGVFDKKIEALLAASKLAATPAAYQGMVGYALQYVDQAVDEDDFPSALKLIAAADSAARKLRSVPQLTLVRKKEQEVLEQQKKFARWKPFADKLTKNPDDAEANLAMGVYQALLKGSWDKGLPLLARSNNPQFKTAAELDVSNPAVAAKQIALAEMWFNLAQKNPAPKLLNDKEFDDSGKIQLLLRSSHWYFDSLNYLSGKEREAVERHLRKITDALPPEYAIGEITKEYVWWNPASGPLYCAGFSPDSKKVVAAGADGMLRVWDLRTGKQVKQIDALSGRIWTVCFSADSRHVLTGGYDGSIRLFNVSTGREVRRFSGHTDYVRSVVCSREGKLVLSGGDDRMVRLWNEETGQEIRSFPGNDHFVWSVALSRNNNLALSGGLDKTVRLWDVASGKPLRDLRGHKDTVLSVAFTPDGRQALSGSTDKTLILWDLEAGKPHVTFPQTHTGYVHSVAVSPDGQRALSGSQDGTIRLWDLHAAKELRVLEHRELDKTRTGPLPPEEETRRMVWHVAFSPDGRLALSCGQDGVLKIWSGSKYR